MRALHRALRRSAGAFAFLPVEVSQDDLSRVRRALRGWSGHDGVAPLKVLPGGAPGVAAVERMLRGAFGVCSGVVISHGDALVQHAEGRLAEGMNVARDVLRREVRGPLVVLLTPEAMAEFTRLAPDLFAVRSTAMSLVDREGEARRANSGMWITAPWRPEGDATLVFDSLDSIRSEAERLRMLTDAQDPPPVATVVDGWLALAERVANYAPDDALLDECIEVALRWATARGYDRGRADALMASARLRRGQSAPVRLASIEEDRAVYERIGEHREADRALKDVAVLQMIKGDKQSAAATVRDAIQRTVAATPRDSGTLLLLSSLTLTLAQTGDVSTALKTMDHDVLPEARARRDPRLLVPILLEASRLHAIAEASNGGWESQRLRREAERLRSRHEPLFRGFKVLEAVAYDDRVSSSARPNRAERRAATRGGGHH
jgi:hypothetical protein